MKVKEKEVYQNKFDVTEIVGVRKIGGGTVHISKITKEHNLADLVHVMDIDSFFLTFEIMLDKYIK